MRNTPPETVERDSKERARRRTRRVVGLIFAGAALLSLVMGVAGVAALRVSVGSKNALVRVYEELAHEVERLQVASERRARKLRTAVVLATPADLASHAAARDEFRKRLASLGVAARAGPISEDLAAIAEIDQRLSGAEDGVIAALKRTSPFEERVALFAGEVQPPREDLDAAVGVLVRRAHAQIAEARRQSERSDALALAGLVASLALALGAIAALAAALRSTLRRLAEAQQRLDEASMFQQHLMGIVGHDIRSPVTAILLGAQRLSKQPDAAAFERYRDSIVRNASRVERMAGLLMDVTRFEAGLDIPVNARVGDLYRTVELLVDEARAANPGRAIELEREGEGWASFDDDRMAQVVTNLLNNAVRHSPEGSPVRVRCVGTDETVALSVSNAGRIDERVAGRVFEPFAKGAPTADRFSAGLGLYVARKLVEAHGGSISIGPSAEGTTVEVRLPRELDEVERTGEGAALH